MPGTLKNYYEILGVPRSATSDQIRTAYRKLLLKFHPDKNIGDTYFEEWSKKINEAFEVLMNAEVRAEYDWVYNETRSAASKPATIYQESSDNDPDIKEEASVSEDAAIKKLAPVYISARQAYIRAARNVTAIEAGLKVKRINTKRHFALGAVMIGAILLWTGITNRDLLKVSSAPVLPVVEQAAVVPLPLPQQRAAAVVENKVDFEPVDLQLRIVTGKAYFFEQPAGDLLGDKFLSKGNKIRATKMSGNFFYCIFQSTVKSSYKIEGWIKKSDVEILAQ